MIPKHHRITEQIRAFFLQSGLPPGSFLPTELDLAAQFKVNRLTMRRSLACLEQQGIISPIQGKRRRLISKAALSGVTQLVACIGRSAADDSGFIHNRVHMRIYERLAQEFQKHNLGLVLIPVSPELPMLPDIVRSPLMKGLIVFESVPPELLKDITIPIVMISPVRRHDDAIQYEISFDVFNGSRKTVEYLAARGHRRPVWVDWGEHGSGYFGALRMSGQQATVRCGMALPLHLPLAPHPVPDPLRTQEQLRRIFQEQPAVDSFVMATSDLAPCLMAGLTAIGVQVPEQVSVMALCGQEPDLGHWRVTGFYNDYPVMANVIGEYIRLILSQQIRHIDRIVLSHYRWEEGNTVKARSAKQV